MRITARTVEKVAEYAKQVTAGAFSLAYHNNPGDGRTYVDGHKMTLSWKGRNAAVLATAYYLGAARAYLGPSKPFPAEIEAIRDEIHGRGNAAASSFLDGQNEGRASVEVNKSKIKNTKGYDVPDVEPDPETGLSTWDYLADGKIIGRVKETEGGYLPIRLTDIGTVKWSGPELKFRDAALESIRKDHEASPRT
ncbi:hypothetical protein AB0E08_08430 [Streptomyces sp. NPDC048281]|uniref:hypothetical protein n=1 Tax=Streptomyces sp. NPDC048281 TaxID=3154715 RepID=UPI00344AF535